MQCSSGCVECSSKNTCTFCEADANLVNGECVCKAGYYMDLFFKTCKPCGSTCATCSSGTACATCPSGFKKALTKCLNCASDEYILGDKCEKCGTNCLECTAGPN